MRYRDPGLRQEAEGGRRKKDSKSRILDPYSLILPSCPLPSALKLENSVPHQYENCYKCVLAYLGWIQYFRLQSN
jgi:hypothetical protein